MFFFVLLLFSLTVIVSIVFLRFAEAEVKKAGKLKTQGKTYIMQDGDICHWKHAARK